MSEAAVDAEVQNQSDDAASSAVTDEHLIGMLVNRARSDGL